VALLEATMWRHVRDPEFLLGALKTYRMMTGLSQMDPAFAADWWVNRLPEYAGASPFPTEEALAHQLAAIEAMAVRESYTPPDEALVAEALVAVCSIPLSRRAYDALRSDPAASELDEWTPAEVAGPNGAAVFTRRSGKGLRTGVPGIFTYAGFHEVVLPRLEEVAGQAALDRSVFAGGCAESADVSVATLAEDMLKLYYEDFIAQWDALLRDIVLVPMTDLRVASENLKDLSSADSALKRLLTAVVAEVDLARPKEEPGGAAAPPKGASKILSKLGKLGKLAKKGAKLIPAGGVAELDTSGQPVSDHFKPLKAAIMEVDGAPPALDDTVIALTALSNVLQTVAASPNPDEAIKAQGGLPELTGAVANQAAILPDPLDDWLAGIAGETQGITQEAVASQLNAIWVADVLPFCKAAIAGRYPFDPSSPTDVNTADFARLFGPGGLIDSFTNDHLLAYVDTAARPWTWRADLGLDDSALAALERARQIRDALFPGGAGPIMAFTLEAKDLSPSATRVTLNLDGQVLNFFNSATRPQPMTWPSQAGTGVITLSFQPIDGSPEVMVSETGAWAFLRLLRENRLQPTDLPELFRLRLAARGHYADFELRAGSVENPFDLQMFASFACPERI
jgi:type VI secretion system protein ImpL